MLPQPLLPDRLDDLVAECKLVRILTPQLKRQIKQQPQRSRYVVEFNSQLYLSLEHIGDQKQREYVYKLIQGYQSGQTVNLAALPGGLRQILQPDSVEPALFWGAFILGGVVGLVVGVLAMAIGMLLLNVTAVTAGANTTEPFSLQIPTVIFVFFGAFSWAVTTWIARRKMNNYL